MNNTSFWPATRLVAEREILNQIRSKGYWIMLGVLLIGLALGAVLPSIIGGGGAPTVATVGSTAERLVGGADVELAPRPAADAAEAERWVREGEVDAAVVTDPGSATEVRVIGLTGPPDEVVAALSVAPPVDVLEPAAVGSGTRWLVGFAFGLVFLLFSGSFGSVISQSVVTEKQTRIVEILVATIPVRALLAGKILGGSLLVFAQVAVLAVVAPLALRAGGHEVILQLIGPALGWFVPFFLLGFVLLAAMWAVAGALVSRMEDLGTTTMAITMLVMTPYFGVVFFNDNERVMTVLSYLPFSAAVAMPVRLFAEEAQVWEPLLAMALLILTTAGVLLGASRLYAGSLLQTGSRLKLRQAWRQAE